MLTLPQEYPGSKLYKLSPDPQNRRTVELRHWGNTHHTQPYRIVYSDAEIYNLLDISINQGGVLSRIHIFIFRIRKIVDFRSIQHNMKRQVETIKDN